MASTMDTLHTQFTNMGSLLAYLLLLIPHRLAYPSSIPSHQQKLSLMEFIKWSIMWRRWIPITKSMGFWVIHTSYHHLTLWSSSGQHNLLLFVYCNSNNHCKYCFVMCIIPCNPFLWVVSASPYQIMDGRLPCMNVNSLIMVILMMINALSWSVSTAQLHCECKQ